MGILESVVVAMILYSLKAIAEQLEFSNREGIEPRLIAEHMFYIPCGESQHEAEISGRGYSYQSAVMDAQIK